MSDNQDTTQAAGKGDPKPKTKPTEPLKAPAPSAQGLDRLFFMRLGLQTLAVFVAGTALLLTLAAAQKLGWMEGGQADGNDKRIYTCAMHPQIRQVGPGRCPICGMKLEVAVTIAADIDEFAVKIEPAARRLANIETAKVKRQTVYHTIETVGSIAIDESRMATIAVYVEGRIEKLFADYTGVVVEKGDHLAILYSPTLYSAQVEYVQSKRALGKMGPGTLPVVLETQRRLVDNALERLVELGMTGSQLAELEKSGKPQPRLTLYSPIGGTVIEKLALEGKYVKEGEPIYRIANLSMVWLMLELYPEDAKLIRFGQQVTAELQSDPGKPFQGRVAFIDQVVDTKTRTVGVRVEVKNGDGRRRPGDYAVARIRVPIGASGDVYDADLAGKWISPMHPQIISDKPGACPICGMDLIPTSKFGYSDKPIAQPTALVVPRDAILMAGANSVVYVETEPGRFEIHPVTLGPITKETAIVLKGLKEGDDVAVAGNFLIDSQMQLAGKPSLIDPSRAIVKRPKKKGPVSIDHIHVEELAGAAGTDLERLYRTYFDVHTALFNNRKVSESTVKTLQSSAMALLDAEALPEKLKADVKAIVDSSAHLHHMDVKAARTKFRILSRHTAKLAMQLRGDKARQPIRQYFCPMPSGGDWLQQTGPLSNPYFGKDAAMSGCGDLIRTLPTLGHVESTEEKKP